MSFAADLLAPERIFLDLPVESRKALYDWLGERLAPMLGCPAKTLSESLEERERLGSTALGEGVAIPHGRIKGLDKPWGVFVRPARPLPFDAPDGRPVSLIYVLLVPLAATDLHLKLLSELAEALSSPEFREALLHAPTPEAVRAAFARR